MSRQPPRPQRPVRPGTRQQSYDDYDYLPNGNGNMRGMEDRVDITKLKVNALRKYAKCYDIHTNATSATREELVTVVRDHFFSSPVEEQEVLYNLAQRHRRSS